MTDATDIAVSFEFEVQYRTAGGWVTIPATNVEPSMDIDRVPYCQVKITVEDLDYAAVQGMDPRLDNHGTGERGNVLRMYLREYDASGTFRKRLVHDPVAGDWPAYLPIRRVEYDHITRRAVIIAGGRESILDDRRRISTTTVDTAATSVLSLVYWSLIDTFSAYSVAADPAASATALPAGDRRKMLPGESHSDLLEPELQAIGYRLFDYWGRGWHVYDREHAPEVGLASGYPEVLQLASYTQREGAPPNADPIIFAASEVFDRGRDYADGVLIKFDNREDGGTVTYQRSGDGENSRGRVIVWERAAPSGNAADEVVARTKIRGQEVSITARARLDVSPGQTLNMFLRSDIAVNARVRAVAWNIADGTMTIRAQTGIPEE